VPIADLHALIEQQYRQLSDQGYRLLGVAIRRADGSAASHELNQELSKGVINRDSEQGMTFLGLIALNDPLKASIHRTVAELAQMGVRLKIITGDNGRVAARVAQEAGLANTEVITGQVLLQLSDTALRVRAAACDVFAEIEPNQKERLIGALRQSGHVVGFMGDGRDTASAALFLASDEAQFITGTEIVVDGGMTARCD
jgi:Mg2+-importing ATPase